MDGLRPDHLLKVYSFLPTLKDIANASLVCKAWCYLLWREEQQQALWIPRVTREMMHNQWLRNMLMKRLMREQGLKGLLLCETQAICESYSLLVKSVENTIKKMAVHISAIAPMVSAVLGGAHSNNQSVYGMVDRVDARLSWWATQGERQSFHRCLFLSSSAQGHKAQEPISVYVLCGSFDQHRVFQEGDVIFNGQLAFRGQFANGSPNGQGELYHQGRLEVRGNFVNGQPHGYATYYLKDGQVKYAGEWVHGQQHGPGVLYHDGGGTIPQSLFSGHFEHNEQVRGTWFNDDGSLVHFGHRTWFEDNINQQTLGPAHVCSFQFTKKCFMKQPWWHCRTCYPELNMGCCFACAKHCHAGHDLVPKPASQFFCDCGDGKGKKSCQVLVSGCGQVDCCSFTPPSLEPLRQNQNDEAAQPLPQPPQNGANQEASDDDEDDENDENEDEDEDEDDNAPNLRDFVRNQLQQNPRQRVFLEVNPETFDIIGLQLVAAEQQLAPAPPAQAAPAPPAPPAPPAQAIDLAPLPAPEPAPPAPPVGPPPAPPA
jgi:hypothetical protein